MIIFIFYSLLTIKNKEDEASEKQQEKKQHNGLRCKKCWALLCRDDDFDYRYLI